MKMKTFLFVICFMVVLPIHASNLRFLSKSAAVSDFNDQDMEMLMSHIQKALNNSKKGEKTKWINKETGHGGVMVPLSSFEKYDMQCRKLKIFNKAKDKKGTSSFNFCKTKDGTWKIVP